MHLRLISFLTKIWMLAIDLSRIRTVSRKAQVVRGLRRGTDFTLVAVGRKPFRRQFIDCWVVSLLP